MCHVAVLWLVEKPGVARRAALAYFDEPFEAKRHFEHLGCERAQETGVGYLAGMAFNGLAFQFAVFGDVDFV